MRKRNIIQIDDDKPRRTRRNSNQDDTKRRRQIDGYPTPQPISPSTAATTKTTTTTNNNNSDMGLVKLTCSDEPVPINYEVIPLFPGAFLGRTPHKTQQPNDNGDNNNRVDLGITKENGDFVSRKHLEVVSVSPSSITVKQGMEVPNNVLYMKGGILKFQELLRGATLVLKDGDRLLFKGEPDEHTFVAKSPKQSGKVQSPELGRRVGIYYEKGRDVFGVREGAAGWHFGTITKRKRNRSSYELTIDMDDGETEKVMYPSIDVVLLHIEQDKVLHGNITMYTCNPNDLQIGDLVGGKYRNGFNWYRGRVISTIKNERTCDIAYDDGDCECGVPFRYIRLIQRGSDDLKWLIGLSFRRSKIVDTAKDFVLLSNGKRQPYETVISALFGKIRRETSKRCVFWPSDDDMDGSPTKPCEIENSSVENDNGDDDDDDDVVCLGSAPADESAEIKLHLSQQKRQQPKRRLQGAASKQAEVTVITKPKTKRTVTQDKQRPIGVIAPTELDGLGGFPTDDDQQEHNKDVLEGEQLLFDYPEMYEMHASMANTFWKALNSTEPHLGSDMLSLLSVVHNQIPNKHLCNNLMRLMTFGPKNGNHFFPDCNRMNLAERYASDLLMLPNMPEKLAVAGGPDYWRDCLDGLSVEPYALPGDENRTTATSYQRRGQSIHLQACSIQLFRNLLDHLLGPVIDANSLDPLRRIPIIKNILQHGASKVLKLAVNAQVSVWIRNGQYICGDFLVHSNDIPSQLKQFLHAESQRLLDNLSVIVSYLLWIYSLDLDECPLQYTFNIRDTFDRLTRDSPAPFTVAGRTPTQKQLALFWKQVKQGYVASMGAANNLVDDFVPRLSNLLGVSSS